MNIFSLNELNEWWHKSKNVRKYQYLIVAKKSFFLELNNKTYEFYQSNVENNVNTLIFKELGTSIFYKIKSENCANGFFLTNTLEEQTLLTFSKIDKVVVYSGQYNFAHFIWNELSALFLLFNKKNFYFSTNITHKSFLNFENFLDDEAKIYKLNNKAIKSFKHNSLKVGGTYIHKKLSSSIQNIFKYPTKTKKNFYFYIGVKGYNNRRCITNELAFYKDLISDLSKSIHDIFFIIDGFSFFNDIHKKTSYFSDHYYEAQKIIDKLLIFLEYNKINYKVINGYSLYKSLEIIKLTDFYITHEGTMHHKIGWFFPKKKGFIITGSSFSESAALWHSSQCYGAIAPYVFNESTITRVSQVMYSKHFYYAFKFTFNIFSFFITKKWRNKFFNKLNKRRHDRDGVFFLNNINLMIIDIKFKIKKIYKPLQILKVNRN